MVHVRFRSGAIAPGLLILAAGMTLPFHMAGQAASPSAQNVGASTSGAAQPPAGAQLPPGVQAQLDKLEKTLRKARAKKNSKVEAQTLNQTADLLLRVSSYEKAL